LVSLLAELNDVLDPSIQTSGAQAAVRSA